MKKYLFLILIPVLCFTSLLPAREIYPEITQQEREQFHEALDQELLNAQNQVNHVIQEFASQKSAFDPAGKLRVEAAKGSLETKTILVNNFRWAPSTRSPRVREKLLSILHKNFVTMDDLQELEKVVQQERLKLQ